MHLWKLVLVVLGLCLVAGSAQARKAELIDPAPVMIPAGLDQAKVVQDIKRTLVGRGWAVTEERPGEIDSTLNLREHVARIKVTYDATQVRFAYVDSSNLDYKQKRDKRYIHPNYLSWMGYLVSDLGNNFKLSSGAL